MVAPTAGLLRRPNRPGFIGPMIVLQLVRMVEMRLGLDARDEILKEAKLFRLPAEDEPIREQKAAGLHAALRRLWPEDAREIGRLAGQAAADYDLEFRLPKSAQARLARMPRAASAWLLSKTTEQQAWTFCGSGEFRVESASRFALYNNPMIHGEHADHTLCGFHEGFLERLFSTLVHPQLTCREVACAAKGDAACVFEFGAIPLPVPAQQAFP